MHASQGRRLKLIVAYDGALLSGWQTQACGATVQGQIEAAFLQLFGKELRVHGAGRTDAGVHALAQCAHVDLPPTRLTSGVIASALNASLPPQIRILRCSPVTDSFHARFSARGKIYRYRIATAPFLLPFDLGRAWHVTGNLDDTMLRACAHEFIGKHDFAGFAANRGHPVESKIRTIHKVSVHRTSARTTIEFDGDGFLYKMVRLMVGAIVKCSLGKITLQEVRASLRDGVAIETRLVAPAEGLTLMRVRY